MEDDSDALATGQKQPGTLPLGGGGLLQGWRLLETLLVAGAVTK